MTPLALYTIGHSTLSAEAFVHLLQAHGITQLVDVRTVPRSRRNPQFNQDALPQTLRAAGIEYIAMPGLGGWRKARPDSPNTAWRNKSFRGYADYMLTPEFAAHLEELIALARRAPTAIMCAEAVPQRCHRSLVADALVARGIEVVHICTLARAELHRLTPWAKVEGTTVTYPGEPPPPYSPPRSPPKPAGGGRRRTRDGMHPEDAGNKPARSGIILEERPFARRASAFLPCLAMEML